MTNGMVLVENCVIVGSGVMTKSKYDIVTC